MKGVVELIIGLAVAFISVWIVLNYVFPYVSGHTEPEKGGVAGGPSTSGEGGGSGNWKFDIVNKLIKSEASPKTATAGPYIFTSSLEMLGHSFGAHVSQYYNITNTIACEQERGEENQWKVCVVDSCTREPKEIQVIGPPGVDALSEENLYKVIAEAGNDWVCLKFEVIE